MCEFFIFMNIFISYSMILFQKYIDDQTPVMVIFSFLYLLFCFKNECSINNSSQKMNAFKIAQVLLKPKVEMMKKKTLLFVQFPLLH